MLKLKPMFKNGRKTNNQHMKERNCEASFPVCSSWIYSANRKYFIFFQRMQTKCLCNKSLFGRRFTLIRNVFGLMLSITSFIASNKCWQFCWHNLRPNITANILYNYHVYDQYKRCNIRNYSLVTRTKKIMFLWPYAVY